MRKSNVRLYRPAPLGVRRPGSDELFGGPFSPGRRSERHRPETLTMCREKEVFMLKSCLKYDGKKGISKLV